MKLLKIILLFIVGFILLTSFWRLSLVESLIFGLTVVLLLQGALSTFGMMYSFLKPENLQKVLPPRVLYGHGQLKFSLIVPAKNEAKVIGDTLTAMANINYPKDKYEVLVIIRNDDEETIKAAADTIKNLELRTQNPEDKTEIKIIKIDGQIQNKAYSLNIGLKYSTGQVVTVFDAEDEPHPDILKSVAEVFTTKRVDIVQAGVQLINVSSFWYSALNCLEYYYWFKSILPFMSSLGATPLGGNTVFFKKSVLEKLDGWSEDCLTEDADIGIRASAKGYKISMIYLEEMATLEETPVSESEFIRQRTRWDQGYLQILFSGEWLKLATLKEQFLSFYLLIQPLIHCVSVLAIISLPFIVWGLKVNLVLALFSWFPFYFLLVQFGLYYIGLKDLKKYYQLQYSSWLYIIMLFYFIPYQTMLAFAAVRAFFRLFLGVTNWEKTGHLNKHRLAELENEL